MTITNRNSGGSKVYLTEDGLYEVLMQSRKPIAKQFKKKVKEILKLIRKDGGYITTNEKDDASYYYGKCIVCSEDNWKKSDKLATPSHIKVHIHKFKLFKGLYLSF